MKSLVALTSLVLLSGCSLLPVTAKQKIAAGVNSYCERMSHPERLLLRGEVNAMIAPHAVKVTCEGDAE